MKGKDLLSITDLRPGDIEELINRAIKGKLKPAPAFLSGKSLALLFEKPSLRTRVSFELAIHSLGGYALYLSPEEVGLGKREPVQDVARVLDRYVQGIVARVYAHQTLDTLARCASIPVVNALSDREHPCQALSDLMTIHEKLGRLRGVKLAYIGDGNNVANSLLLAATLTGMNFIIASPPGYEIEDRIAKLGHNYASSSGGQLTFTVKPEEAVENADVVYTDVWTSMGQEKETEKRRVAFATYQVNNNLLSLCNKPFLFMHPLPAHHGEEVADGIIDRPASVVFDQAENRLHMQKAVLARLYSDGYGESPVTGRRIKGGPSQ